MKKIKRIVFTILRLLFITICVCVIGNKDIVIDEYGYNFISSFINDNTTNIIKIFTNLGGTLSIIVFSVLLLIFVKNNKIRMGIFCDVVIATIINNFILKNIFRRPRPIGNRLIDVSGYSFPSGHSMISMIFYGYLIYLIYNYIENKKLKWFLIIILGIVILSIGISRIYLGVHYTSDVIGGFLIGIIYLILFINLFNKIFDKNCKS